MRNSKDESALHKVYRYYIRGDYHCDVCPYSWEERNYEGDADAGCWRFGELRDTCRHIRNPISRMIVNKNQNEYEGQWDGWIEYGEQYELCEKLYRNISEEIKEGSYVPDKLREFVEKNDEYNGTEIIQEIVNEYELLAHPYKTPWKKLKEASAEWRKDFIWRHFKCYFRSKRK